jgi:hypothetical protein
VSILSLDSAFVDAVLPECISGYGDKMLHHTTFMSLNVASLNVIVSKRKSFKSTLVMVEITEHGPGWQFLRMKGLDYVKCKMKIKFTSSSLHMDDTAIYLCASFLDE